MATVEYQGDLRTEAKHLKSGQKLTTDAPTDNQGKGEAFSPTDLVCASLCSCMMTIMGQVAQREDIPLKGLKADIVKVMASSPRKIAEINITFTHPHLQATDVQKQKLKNAALTCPVALSLSDNVKQTVEFNF
ncbi:MAG: OsmC family protein [Bacteroidetes bacterium]|nr:OsmC family protein [Bacteroidota bacterium]MBS1540224.1 OsmC family protein [Bacteroidota bacterium]